MPEITPAQIRGARAMLGWSMFDLAKAAKVSVSTIKRMEQSEPQPLSDQIYLTVREALKAAGVTFLDGEDGMGMMLRSL